MTSEISAQQERDRPPPVAGERVHAEHHADLLEQRDQTLGRQGHAEHLEHAGQHPQAPRSVQVQEVAVGEIAMEHSLGEDEHEAFLHRRPLRAEEPAQWDQEGERDDAEHDEVALALGETRACGAG